MYDYYTCLITVIEYTDATGERYRVWDAGEKVGVHVAPQPTQIDTDFEVVLPPDQWIAQDMKKRRFDYGVKEMYENGRWRCTPSGKERIMDICQKCDIPMNTVLRVFKHLETWVPAASDTEKD